MPLAQLMRKLGSSMRESNRAGGSSLEAGPAEEMDCDRSPCYVVTAEVIPQRSRSPCSSSLSSDSSSEAVLDMASSMPAIHQHRTHTAPQASSAGLMTVGSLPSSSAAAAGASHPASMRVLRAKGKAALRGQALHSTDDGLDRLASSMSIEQQPGQTLFPVGSSGSAQSQPYQRAATDPVSLWVATGSISNSQKLPQLLNASGVVPTAAAGDDDDCDEPLASPLSPGAAATHEADPHCEWEDGVVAGWLEGLDPSELIHTGDNGGEEQEHHQQQTQLKGAAGPPCAERSNSTASATMTAPEVVFSSLLYS